MRSTSSVIRPLKVATTMRSSHTREPSGIVTRHVVRSVGSWVFWRVDFTKPILLERKAQVLQVLQVLEVLQVQQIQVLEVLQVIESLPMKWDIEDGQCSGLTMFFCPNSELLPPISRWPPKAPQAPA